MADFYYWKDSWESESVLIIYEKVTVLWKYMKKVRVPRLIIWERNSDFGLWTLSIQIQIQILIYGSLLNYVLWQRLPVHSFCWIFVNKVSLFGQMAEKCHILSKCWNWENDGAKCFDLHSVTQVESTDEGRLWICDRIKCELVAQLHSVGETTGFDLKLVVLNIRWAHLLEIERGVLNRPNLKGCYNREYKWGWCRCCKSGFSECNEAWREATTTGGWRS